MCSLFWQMENDQGDLSDIVRASGGGGGGSNLGGIAGAAATSTSGYDWSFPAEPMDFPLRTDDQIDNFGDPFGSARDPLLHEPEIASSIFYQGLNPVLLKKENTGFSDDSYDDGLMGQEIKPCQLLTRMLQIGPKPKIPIPTINPSTSSLSPVGIKPLTEGAKVNSVGGSNENGGLPMNSPRNPGIKRRKSQMKKVVCIPAPAAANNRPSGEVVPSDLWAWRKYGQKPIKGSPYPRGYYRCSSSKGCSARKQVERSRTDPNMLVITYTSEHNHPWPTQRNALAGSTRAQPSKSASASKVSPPPLSPKLEETLKEEVKDSKEKENGSVSVQEEMGDAEKSLEVDDGELGQELHQSYRPVPPDTSQSDDFFSELGELEPNPLSLIFPHGFSEEKSNEDSESKDLDPFSFFDWSDSSFAGPTTKGL